MTTEKELAEQEIKTLVNKAYKSLQEAEKLAINHKLNFYFDPGGHGTFFGNPNDGDNEYGCTGWSTSHC